MYERPISKTNKNGQKGSLIQRKIWYICFNVYFDVFKNEAI